MRELILAYLKTLTLKGFTVTDELPFSNAGVELYLKNQKRIYVDIESTQIVAFIPVISGNDIDQEITTVKAYFTSDAKQLTPDYSKTVSLIRSAKDNVVIQGRVIKEVVSNTDYTNDLLLTTIEFNCRRIL